MPVVLTIAVNGWAVFIIATHPPVVMCVKMAITLLVTAHDTPSWTYNY